jgi:hypothetical protein
VVLYQCCSNAKKSGGGPTKVIFYLASKFEKKNFCEKKGTFYTPLYTLDTNVYFPCVCLPTVYVILSS